MCYIFCFKQMTAYEMRISDWSSDVCSSDLLVVKDSGHAAQIIKVRADRSVRLGGEQRGRRKRGEDLTLLNAVPLACCVGAHENQDERIDDRVAADGLTHDLVALSRDVPHLAEVDRAPVGDCRSEEHPSELQSLMRISS